MIKLKNIYKSYIEAGNRKFILENTNLDIANDNPIIILGSSGSGKTTLLNIISGIDDIDEGEIHIFDKRVDQLNDNNKADFRKKNIGFVFQFYNLIPTLTVEENILLPLELIKDRSKESKERVLNLLDEVGLLDRLNSYPDTLSGGEQQRVSLVRALAHKPRLLIADEPTGNLDKDNSDKIIKIIRDLCNDFSVQLIMATHNQALIESSDTVIQINNKSLEAL